ncbi:MAG TPA: hypothetical protein VLL77_13105 [Anaerolineales bacterium]|nr:hypothetical protein [Anaerolineales bacterium]
MGEDRRLAALEGAYQSWVDCIEGLPEEKFLAGMEAGTPRDLAARLIGWNQLAVLGAQSILQGKPPAHHKDFGSGYANVNRDLAAHEPGTDRKALLAKLASTERQAVEFFRSVGVEAWNQDFGVRHPDGGPATVRRCLEELTRDYLNATDEVLTWLANP